MTVGVECPGCKNRVRVPESGAGSEVVCGQCGMRLTVSSSASAFELSKAYRTAPVPGDSAGDGDADNATGRPTGLVVLIVLTCVHILLNIAIFLLGLLTRNTAALFGGLVSTGFYVAIAIGLVKMQEWARILIIWLSYVGMVASVFILAPLEIATLIFAHSPSVRKATKRVSVAASYIYREHSDEKGTDEP